MKKMWEVESFRYAYLMLNRITMETYGPFKDLEDTVAYIKKYIGVDRFIIDSSRSKLSTIIIDGQYYYNNQYHYNNSYFGPVRYWHLAIICKETGELVDWKTLSKLFARRKRGDKTCTDVNLILRKNNIKKIKQTYRSGYHYYPFINKGYYIPGIILSSFRKIKTKSERSKNASILKEYRNEYLNLIRSKRANLPNSYDDIHLGVYDQYKSWKHNSKRRKQWIPK